MDEILADYKRVVLAVKEAAIELHNVDPKEALRSATHLMMAMLPFNCPQGCDLEEDCSDGEGWKHGRPPVEFEPEEEDEQ